MSIEVPSNPKNSMVLGSLGFWLSKGSRLPASFKFKAPQCPREAWAGLGTRQAGHVGLHKPTPCAELLPLDRRFDQPSSQCGEPNSLSVPTEGSPVDVVEGLKQPGPGSSCRNSSVGTGLGQLWAQLFPTVSWKRAVSPALGLAKGVVGFCPREGGGRKFCLTDSLLSRVWGGSGLCKAVLRGALLAEGLREAWPHDFFT